MRLSVWQFLGLLLALVALYFVYHYWWIYQDRKDWSNRLQNRAINSSEEIGDSQPKTDFGPAESWSH